MQINTYKMIYLMVCLPLFIFCLKKLIQKLTQLPNYYKLEINFRFQSIKLYYYFNYCKVGTIYSSWKFWRLYDYKRNLIITVEGCNTEFSFTFNKIKNQQLIKCLKEIAKCRSILNEKI